jgi:cobaltochelatase CobS
VVSDLEGLRPDRLVSVREVFGIDSSLSVPAFSERD